MASPSVTPIDRVEHSQPDSGFDLCILSMFEKPGWQARISGTQTRATHPGSAISFEDQVYEVIQIEPAAGTTYTYRYALRKWEDQYVVRKMFPYSLQQAQAVARDLQQQRKLHRQHSWLVYLFPITGLLPTPLLQRWQREWGLPMRGASFASAILFGFPGLGLFSYFMFGREEANVPVAAVFLVIGLEQMIRLFWLASSETAQGSFFITLLWGLVHPHGLEDAPRRRSNTVYATLTDEVRQLKDQPWDVEVVTVFRDPVLLGDAPVLYDGQVYQPVGNILTGKGLYRRYVFRLKRLEGGRAQREYRRDRTPRQLASLIEYERRRDRVHAWEMFYGLLPAARQLELEKKYELLSARATEYSALLVLAGAILKLALLLISRFDLSQAFALYFAAESIYRISVSHSRGEPVGSLLGWVLSPFLKG